MIDHVGLLIQKGGEMKGEELRCRLKQLALRIIKLVKAIPKTLEGNVLGKQILRSGTSIAANYYSACKARSRRDFISKVGIAEEEADETLLWLELIVGAGLVKNDRIGPLRDELNEIISILAASRITAKKNAGGESKFVIRQS